MLLTLLPSWGKLNVHFKQEIRVPKANLVVVT